METILGYLAQAFPIISSIAIVLIVPKVVSFLNTKIDQQKLEAVFAIAKRVVLAAEEDIKGEKKGAERYVRAVQDIKQILEEKGIDADGLIIDRAIQSAVWLMHRAQLEEEGYSYSNLPTIEEATQE